MDRDWIDQGIIEGIPPGYKFEAARGMLSKMWVCGRCMLCVCGVRTPALHSAPESELRASLVRVTGIETVSAWGETDVACSMCLGILQVTPKIHPFCPDPIRLISPGPANRGSGSTRPCILPVSAVTVADSIVADACGRQLQHAESAVESVRDKVAEQYNAKSLSTFLTSLAVPSSCAIRQRIICAHAHRHLKGNEAEVPAVTMRNGMIEMKEVFRNVVVKGIAK